jgi:phosphohistidine phosphatase
MALASPAERVKRTLEASGLDLPTRFEEQAYLADAATLMALLRTVADDQGAVLLAAHNPGLQELAIELVPADAETELFDEIMQKYPTAAYAVFELGIDNWADLAPGCGKLVHFARPRDLDPALGPED